MHVLLALPRADRRMQLPPVLDLEKRDAQTSKGGSDRAARWVMKIHQVKKGVVKRREIDASQGVLETPQSGVRCLICCKATLPYCRAE